MKKNVSRITQNKYRRASAHVERVLIRDIRPPLRRRSIKTVCHRQRHVYRVPALRPFRINIKRLAVAFFICLNAVGLATLPNTAAYFSDREQGGENQFTSASLNFSLNASDWQSETSAYNLQPGGESVTRAVKLLNHGSLDFTYGVSLDIAGGSQPFCSALLLTARRQGIEQYSGPLLSLTVPDSIFAPADTWDFIVKLPADAAHFDGDICDARFTFTGWQSSVISALFGLSDSKQTSESLLRAHQDSVPAQNTGDQGSEVPHIVINEFLPNPTGADNETMPGGEWVELYNLGTENVDLAGWYVYDNDDGHPVPINADHTTSGTVIVSHGFLVVYLNGIYSPGWLDNSADSVRLYNGAITDANSQLIDSYAYDGVDHSVQTPTPGETNGTDVTSDPADVIVENKSFARFPDGTGLIIDPVPTPGRPNNIEEVGLSSSVPAAEAVPEQSTAGSIEATPLSEPMSSGGASPLTPSESSSTPQIPLDASSIEDTQNVSSTEDVAPEESVVPPSEVAPPVIEEMPAPVEQQEPPSDPPIISADSAV